MPCTEPNPYLLPNPSVISFSGGRTSAYMLRQILDAHGGTLPEWIKVIYCNTGKERPETLTFVERVSIEWNVPVVWLEYRRWTDYPGDSATRWACRPRKTATVRTGLEVVNYATASRNGEPFIMAIEHKRILPNVAIRYCTQWLKIKTNWRYCRNLLGWKEYANAIGLRADEPKRVAKLKPDPKSTTGESPIAPLSPAGVTRGDVMDFWQDMRGGMDLEAWLALPPPSRPGWDLALRPHEGNCDLCFLKGQGKLLAIMQQNPELVAWWIEQEQRFQGKTRLFEAGRFRKTAPSYQATLELSQQPGLFDLRGAALDCGLDECRCTD